MLARQKGDLSVCKECSLLQVQYVSFHQLGACCDMNEIKLIKLDDSDLHLCPVLLPLFLKDLLCFLSYSEDETI